MFPTTPETLLEKDGLVLKVWTYAQRDVDDSLELPDDRSFVAFRDAVRSAGADVRLPSLHVPPKEEQTDPSIWADELHNNALIYRGDVGAIKPVSYLDALLFAEQNARFLQLDRPTEFLASVLRRESAGIQEIAVVFGAGNELFPPKAVYGFDVVDSYLSRGWSFWYMLHNHTLQREGDTITLGVPAPSASDVRLARSLAAGRGLENIRVTNGFYTFTAAVEELAPLRAR